MNPALFLSTFGLIALSELPDKTAVAILLLATRKNPFAIFIGVALAFLIQTVVAILFGHALGLLPPYAVKIGSSVLFLLFAYLMWKNRNVEEAEDTDSASGGGADFLKVIWTSFVVIFIAEWGDLTQFATAALVAQYKDPLTIGVAATLALWFASAVAILLGNRAKHLIRPALIKKFAAFAFVLIAGWQIWQLVWASHP